MSQVSEKELKRYFKRIKALLPLYGKKEKLLLADLEKDVRDFVEANPGCSIQDVNEHFQTPHEIVSDYLATLSALDVDALHKRLSVRKWVRRAIVSILILCVLMFLVCVGMAYKIYLEAKDQIITQEVIVIE